MFLAQDVLDLHVISTRSHSVTLRGPCSVSSAPRNKCRVLEEG